MNRSEHECFKNVGSSEHQDAELCPNRVTVVYNLIGRVQIKKEVEGVKWYNYCLISALPYSAAL